MPLAEERLNINGSEHYVIHILPAKEELPLMIWVPSGPGETDSLLVYKAAPILSRLFHTISYDPRGAGRTYEKDPVLPKSREELVSDLSVLVEEMCSRYKEKQVILFARGFGTAVAVDYITAHPDRILAYIAASQVICPAKAEKCRCEAMELMFNKLGQVRNILFMSEIHSMTGGEYHLEQIPFHKRWKVKMMQLGMGVLVSPAKWNKQKKALIMASPNFKDTDLKNEKATRKACRKLDLVSDFDFEKTGMDRFRNSFLQLYLSGTMDFVNPYPMVRDTVIGEKEKGQAQNPEYLVNGKRTMIFIPDARDRFVLEDPVAFWALVFKYLPPSLKSGFPG